MKNYYKAKKIADDIYNIMNNNPAPDNNLQNWVQNNNAATDLINKFSNSEKLADELNHFVKKEKYIKADQLVKKLNYRTKIKLIKMVSTIAVVFIGLSFFFWNDTVVEVTNPQIDIKRKDIIKPTVILASGKKVAIENATTIKASELIEHTVAENIEYNTLIVPAKYTLKIDLEDGTIVHINANSELRYPSKFIGDKREVFLKGEAFFEVMKNGKPFIVNCSRTEIKVYGTRFNINNYNEEYVKTMLIEGSVGVTIDAKETILKPNQLSVVDILRKENTVSNVLPEKHIAWMNGYFRYDNDPLEMFIEELGRWYDVKFSFKNQNAKNLLITSSFRRDLPLTEILNTTAKTTNLTFKLEKGGYTIE